MPKGLVPCIENRSVGGCYSLAPEDQEKTFLISPEGSYHYTVMPFGLKNAGAMY